MLVIGLNKNGLVKNQAIFIKQTNKLVD